MVSKFPYIKLQSTPFFFIIGRPRSGTTLLRTLFDAHPNVAIPLECKLIINLERKYGGKKKWEKRDLLSFYNDLQEQPKFDTWTIDNDKLKSDLLNCEGEVTFSSLCKIIYFNYISFFDKNDIILFGDKNPAYSLNANTTKKLMKIFPEAKFIHIIRDYRDQIRSVQKLDFEMPLVPLIAYRWKYSFKTNNNVKNKFPHLFYTIKYEDLVKDPPTHLQNICNFLGIEYTSSMLEYYKKKDEGLKVYPLEVIEKFHKGLLTPINPERIYLWQSRMPERDIKIADMVVGKYAELSGYSRKYKKVNFFLYLKVLPVICYGRFWYMLNFIIDKLPYKIRMEVIKAGPIMPNLYLKLFKQEKS